MLRFPNWMMLIVVSLVPSAAFAAPEGAESRELVNPLISEMGWSLVLFVLFFLALSFLVWPKILGALQARESKITGDLEQAEQKAREAAATLEKYNQQLAEAQQEATRVIGQARADADRAAAQLKSQAENEINAAKQRATAEIAAAKEAAINDLYDQAGTLATQVAGRILQREINPQDQQALINESLSQLKSQNN